MRLVRKIVQKMEDTIPSTIPFWFAYSFKSFFHKKAKEAHYSLTKAEIDEIKQYYAPYVKNINVDSHNVYYHVTGKKDVRFIPDYLFYRYIDPYFNNYDLTLAYEDKNYYDVIMKDYFKLPHSVIRRIGKEYYDSEYHLINEETAIKIIKEVLAEEKELVAKPTLITGSGVGITFVKENDDVKTIIASYKEVDFAFQKVIKQHHDLSSMHPSSINTIRVISFFFKGKVYILGSVLRIGTSGHRLDNNHQDGVAVGIKEDGSLMDYAIDQYGKKTYVHPQGFVYKEGKVPSYDLVKEKIKQAHLMFPHYKIINWDISIDPEGQPLFVEFNLRLGGIYVIQYCLGPIFGDLTDEVLKEVFKG